MRKSVLAGSRAAMLCSVAFALPLGAVFVVPATAQTANAASYSIRPQNLGSALASFADRAGLKLLFPSHLAAGRTSAGLSGTYTPQQALSTLLAGSGLSYNFTSANTVTISDPRAEADAVADGDAVQLETIDVTTQAKTGGMNPDTPYETPGSTSHISTEQIDRVPTGNPADIFKSTPGVISAGNRVGPSMDVNIRGLQGSGRVNVMVDGTRQTSGSYRGYRGARSETYVDPDFIAGVDITKGPDGGAGGVGAMGGVVNLRTINAQDIVKDGKEYGARIKAAFGTNTLSPPPFGTETIRNDDPGFNGDAWNGSAAVATTQENFDLVAGFSRRKAGNYFAGGEGKDTFLDDRSPFGTPAERQMSPFRKGDEVFNTSQDVTTFLAKGTVRWGDGHSFKLGYTRYENTYGENYETLLLFALPGSGAPTPASQHELSETVTNTFTSEYKYQPSGNELIDLTAHLWASDLETVSGVVFANSASLGTGELDIRTYGGDVANTSIMDTPIGTLTTENGVEFVFESARSDQIVQSFPWGDFYYSFNPNGDRTLASVFNRSKLDVTEWLSVSGGLRFDYYETEGKGLTEGMGDQSGDRVNPQVAVTLEPVKGLQFFGAYTEGWRPPSLREQASLGAGGIEINSDLKPETSRSFEFGVNYLRDGLWTADDKLRIKAVRFDNDYEDYIIRGRNPATFAYTWSNIDKATFKGIELSGSYDAGFAFIEAALTRYDDVDFCNDDVCGLGVVGTDYGVMTIPPEYIATLTAGARVFDRRLTFGARGYFIGERYGGYMAAPGSVNPPVYYAENVVVDLFGSYKASEEVTLDFSVENLTDRYYIDPMATAILPSPGRTVRAGLTARF